jgi:hypothetical protein
MRHLRGRISRAHRIPRNIHQIERVTGVIHDLDCHASAVVAVDHGSDGAS